MELTVVSVAERPELAGVIDGMPNAWPAFMLEDPVADALFGRLYTDFPQYQLGFFDGQGELVGKVNSLPFAWTGEDADLPDRGWDGILLRGFAERARGVEPNAASLIEARVVPGRLGGGLSIRMLDAARENARQQGASDLFGPVRPTHKHLEPRTPIGEYAFRVREDGLPVDPWLRTHVRAGGRIVAVCPASMVVHGSLAQWRSWTGLRFDTSGSVDVPDALVPVHVSIGQDHAVYVEPNVWVHHRLG